MPRRLIDRKDKTIFTIGFKVNLYVFITHQQNINSCHYRISSMMQNLDLPFLIVQGGFEKDSYDEQSKVLSLNCNDKYLGLPEKVMKAFHYLLCNDTFDKYTHFVKCDDDISVIKDFQNIKDDYLGKVNWGQGDRNWHIGKTGTFWDNLPYLGEYKPWCLGGNGYIVSRQGLKQIIPNHDYLEHLYEDLYIGTLMNRIAVLPKEIQIEDYLRSPDHHS